MQLCFYLDIVIPADADNAVFQNMFPLLPPLQTIAGYLFLTY